MQTRARPGSPRGTGPRERWTRRGGAGSRSGRNGSRSSNSPRASGGTRRRMQANYLTEHKVPTPRPGSSSFPCADTR
jgi:hypothetical protein